MCKKSAICSYHLVTCDKVECFVCKKGECKQQYDQQEVDKRRRRNEESGQVVAEEDGSSGCSTEGCDAVLCASDGCKCCMCSQMVCEECSARFNSPATNEEEEALTFCSRTCYNIFISHNRYVPSYLYCVQPQY